MNIEKYLRKEKIKKDATEAASKSVNEIFEKMMKSEFESLEDVRDVLEDHKNIYFDSKSNMYAAKKEETEDSVSYPSWEVTYLNGAWYAYQHQQSKVDELQKRVDAVKGLAQTLWEKSEEKHQQGKMWESKTLGECADEILDVLEQVIKGGFDASN